MCRVILSCFISIILLNSCAVNGVGRLNSLARPPDILVCRIKSGISWSNNYFYFGFKTENDINYFRPAFKSDNDGRPLPVVVILDINLGIIKHTVPIADPRLPKIDFGNCSVGTSLEEMINENRVKYF